MPGRRTQSGCCPKPVKLNRLILAARPLHLNEPAAPKGVSCPASCLPMKRTHRLLANPRMVDVIDLGPRRNHESWNTGTRAATTIDRRAPSHPFGAVPEPSLASAVQQLSPPPPPHVTSNDRSRRVRLWRGRPAIRIVPGDVASSAIPVRLLLQEVDDLGRERLFVDRIGV